MIKNITTDIIPMHMQKDMMDLCQLLVLPGHTHHVRELIPLIKELQITIRDTRILLPSKQVKYIFRIGDMILHLFDKIRNKSIFSIYSDNNISLFRNWDFPDGGPPRYQPPGDAPPRDGPYERPPPYYYQPATA